MKTGLDAQCTVENKSESSKHENSNPTPTVPPKTSPGVQNMKTGPDALGTAENESGCTKNEKGT
jgi:hypothetical protein